MTPERRSGGPMKRSLLTSYATGVFLSFNRVGSRSHSKNTNALIRSGVGALKFLKGKKTHGCKVPFLPVRVFFSKSWFTPTPGG